MSALSTIFLVKLVIYCQFAILASSFSISNIRLSKVLRHNLVFPHIASSINYVSRIKHLYESTSSDSFVVTDKLNQVKSKLANIVDPESGNDIVTAGITQNFKVDESDNLSFNLVVTDLNSIINEEIKKLCLFELSLLEWVNGINISIVGKPVPVRDSPTNVASKSLNDIIEFQSTGGLSKVKQIIAVSSCKGGVGKSTVSVNLAYTLSLAGAKVGILDADIYGPSLPTMTKPLSTDVIFSGNQIQPLQFEGVKLMSMGFISKGAAIMRGPMVNQILNQFISLCDWGELDYLIVDMPPGTGDIQLTLAQIMNITASIVVTTPQRLSFVDVVKGIDMFDTVNVPCIAVVENMAGVFGYNLDNDFYDNLVKTVKGLVKSSMDSDFDKQIYNSLKQLLDNQKTSIKMFGQGYTQRLREMWGIQNIVSVPLMGDISFCGDNGTPYVLKYPDSEFSKVMIELAGGVIDEIENISKSSKYATPTLRYDTVANSILVDEKSFIDPYILRCNCKCAVCVEEFTGVKLLDDNSIDRNVKPLNMVPIGRYAISVDWSDNHKSLFPFRQILELSR